MFSSGSGTLTSFYIKYIELLMLFFHLLKTKLYCSFVFLDVSQAFDRVWHEGLQFKIRFLPSLFLLIKSNLTNRHYQVQYNTATSGISKIKAGVPQGGILSPFLF